MKVLKIMENLKPLGNTDEANQRVVRLPPYHCDLNPIELIWANVKQKVAAHNLGSRDVKQLAEEAFNSITPETWKNCCNHVVTLEKASSTTSEDVACIMT